MRMTTKPALRQQTALQELLRSLRLAAGLRQEDVAKKLGIPQPAVSKYEMGERRLDILEIRSLCEIFGLTLSEFVLRLEDALRSSEK